MNLIEIAKIYIDLVEADGQIPNEEHRAKEEINVLRSKYHDLLMQKMREERINFFDRFDATNKAFEIVRKEKTD